MRATRGPSVRVLTALLLPGLTMLASGCATRPPTVAHVHIGHAVTGVHVTPAQEGYFVVAEKRGQEVLALATEARNSTDLGTIKTTIAKAIVATGSEEDFGLKHSLVMASNHLTFASTSPDASLNLQEWAPVFAQHIARPVERCELIILLGKDVAASSTAEEAKLLVDEIQKAAQDNLTGEYGLVPLRQDIQAMIGRESPPYVTVEQWYLFNLVRLPNGNWVFDKLGRGGNIEGYK